jgi:uncharacterized protein
MATKRVAWRRTDETETDEHATLTVRDTGLSLIGTVIGAHGGIPLRIEYRVLADGAGLTTAAHVRELRGFEQRSVMLERSAKGAWSVNGQLVRALRGCTDVDLGFSPSTNSLPFAGCAWGLARARPSRRHGCAFPI